MLTGVDKPGTQKCHKLMWHSKGGQVKKPSQQSVAELEATMKNLKEAELETFRRLRQVIEVQVRLGVLIEQKRREAGAGKQPQPAAGGTTQ